MGVFDLLSLANDVLYDALPYALLCLGFVLTAKYIRFPDLTCSGTFVLGAAVAATLIVKGHVNPYIATVLAVGAGCVGGLLTAAFYLILRMDRLMASILSAFVLYSINLLLLTPTLSYQATATPLSVAESHDYVISPPSWFCGGDCTSLSWHPWVIAIFALLVIGVKVALDWFLASESGLALRALEDEEAGESVLLRNGLSPAHFRLLALVLGNGIVALAGAVTSYKENAANANRGFDILVTGLVAFLTGTQIVKMSSDLSSWANRKGGERIGRGLRISFTTGAIVGALLYFLLMALSNKLRIDSAYTKIILVGFVACSLAYPNVVPGLRKWLRRGEARPIGADKGTLLSVQELRFRYPLSDVDTLNGISFEVMPGDTVQLKGGNGSGKTTALRLVGGYLQTDGIGQIIYEGRDVTQNRRERLKDIAYVDQNANRGVVSMLTAEENLALAAANSQSSPWRRALRPEREVLLRKVLSFASLPVRVLKTPAATLSGGQRQVLNLLTLLARQHMPRLVLLDEPANNLDVGNTDRCRQIIQHLKEQGVAVVLISHSPLNGVSVNHEIDLEEANSSNRPSISACVDTEL